LTSFFRRQPNRNPRRTRLQKFLQPRPTDTILFPRSPIMHILVADDDPANRELLTELLHHSGHSVTAARDGNEALAALAETHFDVVLMDEEMPRMSGLDATRTIIQATKPGEKRPIIVGISGNSTKEDEERCLAVGMDAFLAKPIRAAELFSILATLARHSEPALQPPDSASQEEDPSVESLWAHLERTTGGNPKLAQSLVKTFLEDAPKKLTVIRRAVSESDAGALAAAAHAFKGSLSLIGAPKAAGTARNLQAMGRLGNLNGAAAELAVLESEFEHLRRELLALQVKLAKPPASGKDAAARGRSRPNPRPKK